MDKAEAGSKIRVEGASDHRSEAEKKRAAEASLKMGICVEDYFGKKYCDTYYKLKGRVTTTDDPWFSEIETAPIVCREDQPGYYNVDESGQGGSGGGTPPRIKWP